MVDIVSNKNLVLSYKLIEVKLKMYLLLLSCTLLLQSCFEIIEQVFIKDDGSGNFELVLNMSKSKTKINSIMKMKKVNGHDVPGKDEITKKVNDLEKTIQQTPGISNVKSSMDFDNYIATLSCSFTKVSSLNAAVKNISNKEKNKNPAVEKSYEYDAAGKLFSRLNKFSLKEEYHKMSNADREIFATANYTSIFRFTSDVTATSNKESKVAGNKKAVMLKLNVLDIITGKNSIENKINLTK
jgi:hypothetical protein